MKNLFLIFLLLIISCFCKAQHAIIISGGRPVIFNIHEGSLKYIDGKTIQGPFQYSDMEFPGPNLKLFDSTRKYIIKRIPTKDIQKITFAGHDPDLNNSDSTYFKRINKKHRLFRQLSFGDTKIFDDLFSVNENPGRLGNEFVVIQDSTIMYISGQQDLMRKLAKLPKPFILEKGQTIEEIIKLLNKKSQ